MRFLLMQKLERKKRDLPALSAPTFETQRTTYNIREGCNRIGFVARLSIKTTPVLSKLTNRPETTGSAPILSMEGAQKSGTSEHVIPPRSNQRRHTRTTPSNDDAPKHTARRAGASNQEPGRGRQPNHEPKRTATNEPTTTTAVAGQTEPQQTSSSRRA